MASLTHRRTRGRVRDLPSDFPQVPVLDNEASLDAAQEAKTFLDQLSRAVESSDWHSFENLFAEQCWWKDQLSLTFDKRSIRGREDISSMWQTLAPRRKPKDFKLAGPGTQMVELPPAFVRLSPGLATLDIPFSFSLSDPDCFCVGIAKTIPIGSSWKIWILTTAVQSLKKYPFQALPRALQSGDLVDLTQRGKATSQGLPRVQGILDAVVVGGSTSGIADTIMLDSIGSNVVCFDLGSPGQAWTERYRSIRLHHPKYMIQLPMYPVPAEIPSNYLTGLEVAQYMAAAVRDLRLPFFAKVEVVSNVFDKEMRLWTVSIKDVESGQMGTVQTRNLIFANGFLVSKHHPSIPVGFTDSGQFPGPVQHTSQYTTADPYKGKDVVVVGSGNSAHDIAKDLGDCPDVKSVTLLQRSPTVLFAFETFIPFISGLFQGNVPVDTADFLSGQMPMGIMRDMANGALAGFVQSSEELYSKLEAKGYLIDRKPELMQLSFEHRGASFYFDAPGAFDLVLRDRIKIARGTAVGLTDKGVRVRNDETGTESTIKAQGVVLATGYSDTDLPKQWAETGFLDAESAAQIENMGVQGVDVEGEMIGQVTRSGHPRLYFAGLGLYVARQIARFVAIQVMVDDYLQTP